MKSKARILCLGVSAFTMVTLSTPWPSHGAWQPPIGIPAPPFGIIESAPARPAVWDNAVPGFYYVDENGAGSTDTSNPYGYPAKPRKTIPLSLPAGSVVELHGTYTRSHGSPNIIAFSGTASQPVFVRGLDNGANMPRATRKWTVSGSYGIVENVYFDCQGSTDGGFSLSMASNADHIAIRFSELRGDPALGSGIAIGAGAGFTHSNVVIYGTSVHDQGDPSSPLDQDSHCVAIGARADHVWLLDSELYYASGDGAQVNAGDNASMSTTHHIYAGRNHIHKTRQAGLAVKQAVDVVFSQNHIHDIIEATWSASKGLGFQYGPERVWFLFNDIHDCSYGIYSGSDSGLGWGKDIFIIGNVIHDIANKGITDPSWNPANAWASAAIMLRGGTNRYIVNNTIWRTNAGIYAPQPESAAAKLEIVNNIIGDRTEPLGRDVLVESGTMGSISSLTSVLFGGVSGTERIQWGGSTIHTLPSFQANTGKGQNSMVGNPLFSSAPDNDFRLLAGSPAIDKGSVHPAYQVFLSLYGIDIATDMLGNSRPQGAAYDIGAFESVSGVGGGGGGGGGGGCAITSGHRQGSLFSTFAAVTLIAGTAFRCRRLRRGRRPKGYPPTEDGKRR